MSQELQKMSDEVCEVFKFATEQVSNILTELERGLREQANRATDIAVTSEHEEQKRAMIVQWRESAAAMATARRAVQTVPLTGVAIRDEIGGILARSLEMWLVSVGRRHAADYRESLTELMRSNAANIGHAYAGRILPET